MLYAKMNQNGNGKLQIMINNFSTFVQDSVYNGDETRCK